MLEFIKDNWANILLIIVGSFALATYILQERKKKIDAASLIVLQIDEFQERLREISTFIVDGQLNETAFYESLPLMDTDYWNKYKHYFVRKMDATSYTALNQLYEYVSEIQEQQMALVLGAVIIIALIGAMFSYLLKKTERLLMPWNK